MNRKLLLLSFFQCFIGDAAVCDLITFFIPENSSCFAEAFLYGSYACHDILSYDTLFIIKFLDVTSSILYL